MKRLTLLFVLLLPQVLNAQDDLAARLRELEVAVLAPDSAEGKALPQQVRENQLRRLWLAAARENEAWEKVVDKKTWERFRDQRLEDLRRSLNVDVSPPSPADLRVTGTVQGDGFHIDNLLYESRPGLVVTANLYRPAKPGSSMPGIVIVHSHHNPKQQVELQDMGMTWARQGCLVLVMDQLGHGERRQHPFTAASKYPGKFQPGRQDYYFRYNVAQQLQLVGESLMGWMVHDIRCGITLLLGKPGIDPQRILLFGAVAGGGDPAGVTAALDDRVTMVAPFNFGGVQPDYPVPEKADTRFYWFGVGSWETTRSLRLGARDGFAHWLIVGSVAPRRLIHSHEFAWDSSKDPAWPRLQKIFGFYESEKNLTFATGKGNLKGRPPESSHCNNIGPYHRSQLYPSLQKWFAMPTPEKEFMECRQLEEILCLTPAAAKAVKPRLVHELAREQGLKLAAQARTQLSGLTLPEQRQWLRKQWHDLLGLGELGPLHVERKGQQEVKGITIEKAVLGTAPDIDPESLNRLATSGIHVPVTLLLPEKAKSQRVPVVVALAQEGKQRFLKERAAAIAELLQGGVAVCLPDLRGMGESNPGGGRERGSTATRLGQIEQMLGGTLLGARLHDLQHVLGYLREHKQLEKSKIALWGDSFAPVNPPDRTLAIPLDADQLPPHAEPGGPLLTLLGALFEDDIVAVHVQGGLVSYASLLDSPFLYVPHDAIVPGVLSAGDLNSLLLALRPRPVRLQAPVDGLNRRVSAEGLKERLQPVRLAYDGAGAGEQLHFAAEGEGNAAGRWLLERLRGK